MTRFEATCLNIKSQFESLLAQKAMQEPGFDPHTDEAKTELHNAVLEEVMALSIGMLARLTVINDPKNDQAQASARELTISMCQRLGLDPVAQFGLPVDVQ